MNDSDMSTVESINHLKQTVSQNPNNFESHVALIDALKKVADQSDDQSTYQSNNINEELNNAYKHLASTFPLTAQIWLDWIDLSISQSVNQADQLAVLRLIDRSINDYVEPILYHKYVDLAEDLLNDQSTDQTNNQAIDYLRSIYQYLSINLSSHRTESNKFLIKYRRFETSHLKRLLINQSNNQTVVQSSANQSNSQSAKQLINQSKKQSIKQQYQLDDEDILLDDSDDESIDQPIEQSSDQSIDQTNNQSSIQEEAILMQIDRINKLFNHSVSQPINGLEQILSEYKEWIKQSNNQTIDQTTNHTITQIYQAAKKMRDDRAPYEQLISQSNQPINQSSDRSVDQADDQSPSNDQATGPAIDQSGVVSTDRLNAWYSYIQFETQQYFNQSVSQSTHPSMDQSNIDTFQQSKSHSIDRVIVLYERALRECFLHSDMWLSYISFLESIDQLDYQRTNNMYAPYYREMHRYQNSFQSINQSNNQSNNQFDLLIRACSRAVRNVPQDSRLWCKYLQSVSHSVIQPNSQSIQPINQPNNQSSGQSLSCLIDQSIAESSQWMNQTVSEDIDRIDRLTDQLVGFATVDLYIIKVACLHHLSINQSINHLPNQSDVQSIIQTFNQVSNLSSNSHSLNNHAIFARINKEFENASRLLADQSINQPINQLLIDQAHQIYPFWIWWLTQQTLSQPNSPSNNESIARVLESWVAVTPYDSEAWITRINQMIRQSENHSVYHKQAVFQSIKQSSDIVNQAFVLIRDLTMQSIHQSVNQTSDQLILFRSFESINRFAIEFDRRYGPLDQSIHQSINQLINQSKAIITHIQSLRSHIPSGSQSANQLFDQTLDQSADQPIDQPINPPKTKKERKRKATRSDDQSANKSSEQSKDQPNIQSKNQPTNEPKPKRAKKEKSNELSVQSNNQSHNQSHNQSNDHSNDQSNNQSNNESDETNAPSHQTVSESGNRSVVVKAPNQPKVQSKNQRPHHTLIDLHPSTNQSVKQSDTQSVYLSNHVNVAEPAPMESESLASTQPNNNLYTSTTLGQSVDQSSHQSSNQSFQSIEQAIDQIQHPTCCLLIQGLSFYSSDQSIKQLIESLLTQSNPQPNNVPNTETTSQAIKSIKITRSDDMKSNFAVVDMDSKQSVEAIKKSIKTSATQSNNQPIQLDGCSLIIQSVDAVKKKARDKIKKEKLREQSMNQVSKPLTKHSNSQPSSQSNDPSIDRERTLFLKSLPTHISPEALEKAIRELFSQSDNPTNDNSSGIQPNGHLASSLVIESVRLAIDEATGVPKHFAWVIFRPINQSTNQSDNHSEHDQSMNPSPDAANNQTTNQAMKHSIDQLISRIDRSALFGHKIRVGRDEPLEKRIKQSHNQPNTHSNNPNNQSINQTINKSINRLQSLVLVPRAIHPSTSHTANHRIGDEADDVDAVKQSNNSNKQTINQSINQTSDQTINQTSDQSMEIDVVAPKLSNNDFRAFLKKS